MSGFSNSSANQVINLHLRQTAGAAIRNLYFALFTDDPTDAFTLAKEVQTGANPWYVRKATGAWAAPSVGVTSNSTAVTFNPVTNAGLTVTHIGIVEGANATDGTSTLLYSHALSAPKTLALNDVYLVDVGDYTLSLV